jgi:hypothetical protein
VLSGELRPVMFVCVFALMTSSASPAPAGRSMQTVVVSRKSAAMPYSRSERGLDDLLLDLAVERHRDLVAVVVLADVDERVLLGELVQAAARLPPCSGPDRETTGLQRGTREARRDVLAAWRLADRIADRTVPRPRTVAISPGASVSRRGAPVGANTLIEVGFASSPPPTRTRWRGRSVPRTAGRTRRARPPACARS